jgi:hypothetical protein
MMAFRSRPVQAATEAEVIAIHCSDPRYQPHFQQFLNATFRPGHYAPVVVPGGPQLLALADYLPKFGWAGWRWVKFLVDLSRARRVVLIQHDDCRWYHDTRFLHMADDIATRQLEDMHRVRDALTERFGLKDVQLYVARLDGEEAVFDQV